MSARHKNRTLNTPKKKKEFLIAFEKSLGIVTQAAKAINISRKTFYEWYKKDEDFREKIEEIRDMQVDFVETQLFRNIQDGNERSITFYLKYKGSRNGYVDKQEVEHKGGITINYINPEKKEKKE